MRREVRKYLSDIQAAGELIRVFTKDKRFADYEHDEMLRSAVERQLMIIGEALGQTNKLDPGIESQVSSFRVIIGFRNRLVHGYSLVKDDIVWAVVIDDIPRLHDEVRQLLDNSDSQE